uniref:Uncharacterized protein n=1 Tax=Arundo donax TaxID=35708 RepID=A0A0A9GFL0_ARUDO
MLASCYVLHWPSINHKSYTNAGDMYIEVKSIPCNIAEMLPVSI